MDYQIKQYIQAGKKNLFLIYALYLMWMIIPLLTLIGAVFAYANINHEDNFLRSHYIFSFRTFMVGFFGSIIAAAASLFFIGPIIFIAIFIWCVIRSIFALQFLIANQTHPNPLTFWIK
ncbi:MAG: hypothetical protein AB8B66_01090 [Rickettsiaceae bacterium]